MKKATLVMVSLLLVLALAGCGAVLTDAAKLQEYDVSGDTIPSITSVVGEREVTGVESSTSNGVKSTQYTYVSDTVYDDLWAYVQQLMDDGWLVTKAIDLAVVPGSGELAAKSADEGKIVLLSFSYDDAGYIIKITKGKGTLE
jgi:hypothetical protein